MAKAVSSAPSAPSFEYVSVSFVKPLMSANITTDVKCWRIGSSFGLCGATVSLNLNMDRWWGTTITVLLLFGVVLDYQRRHKSHQVAGVSSVLVLLLLHLYNFIYKWGKRTQYRKGVLKCP